MRITIALLIVVMAALVRAQQSVSVWDGVYTQEQATGGKKFRRRHHMQHHSSSYHQPRHSSKQQVQQQVLQDHQ